MLSWVQSCTKSPVRRCLHQTSNYFSALHHQQVRQHLVSQQQYESNQGRDWPASCPAAALRDGCHQQMQACLNAEVKAPR